MSLSPAQINQLRKRAALEAAATTPAQTMAGATTYELQLAQLHQDCQRLKQIQSTEGKVALKAQLLPAYAPYVDGVLAAGRGAQDDVLTTIMLWRLDVGDYAGGLDIAEYVLKYGMSMPDRFERTTGCLIAEEVAEAALKAQKTDGTFELGLLLRTASMTDEQDMPDQARAKLYLAIGRANVAVAGATDEPVEQAEWLKMAHKYLVRAIELHDKCGAKKDLERVDRLLKKHAESKPATTGPGEPPANDQPPSEEDGSQSSEEGSEAETDTGEPPAN
ncbi:terminase endonuclease subunit [Stutzerimonas stutzeri]|uniref:phage terminase small subunit n=1 Tax=Stutzerimonas stutzeri TaxID=316 RepID=UPI00244898F8|nr:terminase endonuclease subunit [Stutzerimonas stutzeri]MDH1587005.1 terminase endonuclease subunit [Stutzerimonas stutzeri]